MLSKEHPRAICYRSPHPILTPDLPLERRGIVANVVFPTGIDRRDDLGSPDRVARVDMPDFLPPAGLADSSSLKPSGEVFIR